MDTGENIKKYRKENKLTQKKLGELIGKSAITIRKYESNSISPSLQTLNNIANALNIETRDLIGEKDNITDKSFLIEKIKKLELVLEEKDLIICKLSTKLCAAQRKLEKIEHYCESQKRG